MEEQISYPTHATYGPTGPIAAVARFGGRSFRVEGVDAVVAVGALKEALDCLLGSHMVAF